MARTATGIVLLLLLPVHFGGGQEKRATMQAEEQTFRCHEPGVRLEGKLVRRWFYGPPGFGETPKRDARDEVFVLKLTSPIRVVAPPNPARDETCSDLLPHVAQVQVWAFQEHQREIRDKVGRIVSITGTLDEDPAPGAHVSVQITPESIRAK
jgi:hypothetical protein